MAGSSRPKMLATILAGQFAGELTQDANGRVSFTYDQSYREDPDATPVSLSMLPSRERHPSRVVVPFLENLLPENPLVLDRWARTFQVSASSPFALLAHVGEDLAGALQFVLPDRIAEMQAQGALQPVDVTYISDRLSLLKADRSAWEDARYPGRFSLAGAQSKFALHFAADTQQWSIPTGRFATTHVFKPALPGLEDQEINEHLCLVAARRLGLDTADSTVLEFGNERALVLGRYDRAVDDGTAVRLHQEDVCQALAVGPTRKYERTDGGPGLVDMVRLITDVTPKREHAAFIRHYVLAVAFNWLIFGPDAHAKNYSLMLDGRDVRPSPLYDISSVLPYPSTGAGAAGFDLRTMAMAMEVNGKYQNNLILAKDWAALARKIAREPDEVMDWVRTLARDLPDAFSDAATEARTYLGDRPVVDRLLDGIAVHSAKLAANLDS